MCAGAVVFLALRELKFARGRFALMGSVVALVALLMVLLSGLSVGLVNDGVSGLKQMPVTHLAFTHDVAEDAAFSRSVVTDRELAAWSGRDGVRQAGALGNTLVNARTSRDVEVDLALFGVEPGSFLEPRAAEGEQLRVGADGILVSPTVLDEGVHLGDTVVVDQLGTKLRVVGVLAEQATFGHVDVAYVPLATWQRIKAGVREGEQAPAHVFEEFTAVALDLGGDAGTDQLVAGDEAAGTTTMTLTQSFDASPGFTAETMTLDLIQGFLYAISALVVGAFFTVVTIQRRGEIAVSRALGASTARLLGDSLVQSLVLLVVSIAVGLGLGLALGAYLTSTPMPFSLELAPVSVAATGLLVLGMLGAAVAVLRITRVDPLSALGGSR